MKDRLELYDIALFKIPKVGFRKFIDIKNAFPNLQEFFSLSFNELKAINETVDSKFIESRNMAMEKAIEVVEQADKLGMSICSYSMDMYPEELKKIYDPPPYFFYKGNIEIISKPKRAAFVGTRYPSMYGVKVCERMVKEAVEAEVVVVSGLAAGIDAVCHRVAIQNAGLTVGVIGCGLDIVYPVSNRALYEDIVKSNGVIISEFDPSTKPEAQNFPKRNRIISGLSSVVIVIESPSKGGSIITAKSAIEQGKEVFAVPGGIYSDKSKGANELIFDGANMVINGFEDVCRGLGWGFSVKPKKDYIDENIKTDSPMDIEILKYLSERESAHIDKIIRELNCKQSELVTRLSFLELKGYVRKTPGMYFSKI